MMATALSVYIILMISFINLWFLKCTACVTGAYGGGRVAYIGVWSSYEYWARWFYSSNAFHPPFLYSVLNYFLQKFWNRMTFAISLSPTLLF